ncbi:MAG: hypothetical protein ABI655_08785 [Phenylobacterium sp.]
MRPGDQEPAGALPRRISGAVGPTERASIFLWVEMVSTARFSQPEVVP